MNTRDQLMKKFAVLRPAGTEPAVPAKPRENRARSARRTLRFDDETDRALRILKVAGLNTNMLVSTAVRTAVEDKVAELKARSSKDEWDAIVRAIAGGGPA